MCLQKEDEQGLEPGKEWRPREGVLITRVCKKAMQKEGDFIRLGKGWNTEDQCSSKDGPLYM